MKQIQSLIKKSYSRKLLAASMAAFYTCMVATSVTRASDIDIYQEAKSGQITLMFMLDISGSMDSYDTSSSGTTSREQSTNGSAIKTYWRNYKEVTETKVVYYYKRTGTSGNRKWWSCGASGSISQSDCIQSISAPSTSGMTNDGGSNPQYYYKNEIDKTLKYYDRITRVKDGMFDLLYGNTTKGITRLSDDKVIGLSTLGSPSNSYTGSVLVPARRLDCVYGKVGCSNMSNNGKTQRTILLETIGGFSASTWTPTAPSYAEAAAYLFGTRTTDATAINIPKYFKFFPLETVTIPKTYMHRRTGSSSSNYKYYECNGSTGTSTTAACTSSTSVSSTAVTGTAEGTGTVYYYVTTKQQPSTTPNYKSCTSFDASGCTVWGAASTTNPTTLTYTAGCVASGSSGECAYESEEFLSTASGSGFQYSAVETKNARQTLYEQPGSLAQSDDIKKCSGQGIYVLTDGAPNYGDNAEALMKSALGSKASSFSCANSTNNGGGWDCTHKFVQSLLDPNKNPAMLKIKTAVVGFGSDFNDLASFDRTKTQAQNIAALGTINTDVKKAAYWGIIGEGGWYSGNSSQDIVDSVNSFLGDLNTDIPVVTTGSPTIPKDMLNPAVLQDDAYYQQFQPSPDKGYQLWAGNMKKYLVVASGKLEGRDGASVTESNGRLKMPTYDDAGKLLTATYDFWSTKIDSSTLIADADENTFGSKKFAAKGGVWSQLKLRTDADGKVQRKLLTNRVATGTGTAATFGDGTSLRAVDLSYLTDGTYQNDPYRGYLISLLGYSVDAGNPSSITSTSLSTAVELRQMGSVMHSLPVLVTNKGKVAYNATTKKIESKDRQDYVLFGTTQGLLQVVDAKTGEEKFAFVPNEMVDGQKEAFLSYTSTNGGMNNLFYGIDGPWALHTEYVVDSSGNLTVGSGKGTGQQGKQLAFGGLRMGGNSYYSLNLQNIDSPTLNFYIHPRGTCSNSNPLGCMGQSWSKPALGYVNWGGVRKLVMIVGGGYDTGYESDSYDQTSKKGAGVYMFSAEGDDAGTLLWWSSANATTSTTDTLPIGTNNSDLQYSVVSEIRTVDRNGDDLIDHLYFGDLGGQLFRIDLDNSVTDLTKFAKAPVRLLNLHESNGKSPRFYDMPSFSVYSQSGETFAVVSIGSGNRSKPLVSYTTGTSNTNFDAIYNIYDKDVASKSLFTTGSSLTHDVTRTTLGKLTESNRYSDTTLVAPYGSNDGWYYEFDNCVAGIDGKKTGCDGYKLESEKVFGTPLAMNYRLYVSTFDSSKPGLSGDCGAGVKGESLLNTFCLPYGQCKSADEGTRGTPIGIGIHNVTVGNCTGDNCGDGDGDGDGDGGGGGGGGEKEKDKIIASASNYCASTGGRMAITVIGGVGQGEATQMCLIPQRWYERNSLIK